MHQTSALSRWVLPAAACVCAAMIAGCTYSADVRNTTDGPVLVWMMQVDAVQPDWVLASARLGPGQYATLGPCRVPFQRVEVVAGNQMNDSVPARWSIQPGTARLDVGEKASTDPGRNRIVFSIERRPE